MTLYIPIVARRNVQLKDSRILRYLGSYAPVPNSGMWQCNDGLRVLGSMDETPNHGNLLHVSLSYEHRDPSWHDIKQVRYAFFGEDIDCMMVLPKLSHYVNLHPHTFHIWQTPTEWGLM